MEKDERLKSFNGKKIEISVPGCEPIEGILDFVSGTEITIKEKISVKNGNTAGDKFVYHYVNIDDIKIITSVP